MRVLKRYFKSCTVRARFERIYAEMEDRGFNLFMRYVAGESIDKELNRYRKNLNRLDSLYTKYVN